MPHPFDDQSFQVGELTVESAADRIAFYAQVELTRDQAGLKRAQQLSDYLKATVQVLSADLAEKALPERLEQDPLPRRPNPFA